MSILMQLSWRPTIGDPTIMGWVTVVAYFVASVSCIAHVNSGTSKLSFWLYTVIALVLLGVNKQLDLQSLITDIGRVIAKQNGW